MSANKISHKQEKEKKVMAYMIKLYCKKKHHRKELCDECSALLVYANERIDQCPFMATKTFCSNCKVHCYKKEQREKIRTIMRFSGPRMLLHKPIMVLAHLYYTKKEKKNQ